MFSLQTLESISTLCTLICIKDKLENLSLIFAQTDCFFIPASLSFVMFFLEMLLQFQRCKVTCIIFIKWKCQDLLEIKKWLSCSTAVDINYRWRPWTTWVNDIKHNCCEKLAQECQILFMMACHKDIWANQ